MSKPSFHYFIRGGRRGGGRTPDEDAMAAGVLYTPAIANNDRFHTKSCPEQRLVTTFFLIFFAETKNVRSKKIAALQAAFFNGISGF